jgi:subtilisin family serine protease
VQRAGGRIKYSYNLVPAMAASLPANAVAGLANNPRIEIIEPDFIATINRADPDYAAELNNVWGVKKIGAGDAHNLSPSEQGQGVNVAVIDTGINYNHPDLAGSVIDQWDFVNNDGDAMDDQGHGTHVAGTIAAHRDGVGAVGVAPAANLFAVKVLDQNGSGSYSNIIAGVEWATAHGAKVTNNSYGGGGNSLTLEAAFRNAAAAGVVSVAAAGNSGTCTGNTDTVGYPGKYNSVIAVAATDINDARPCFSSTGPAVQIAAPGVNIFSTVKSGEYEGGWSGTSMATPHVAGVAALLYGKGVVNSNASAWINDEIRNVLMLTALDLGTAGRDVKFGFGRVRVMEALNAGPVPPVAGVTGISYVAQPGKGRGGLEITVSTVYKPVVPVAGLTVSITVTVNGAGPKSYSGATDANGSVTFTIANAASGVYVTTVNNITGGGLAFDNVQLANSFNKK